jgi:hypothetical protein
MIKTSILLDLDVEPLIVSLPFYRIILGKLLWGGFNSAVEQDTVDSPGPQSIPKWKTYLAAVN